MDSKVSLENKRTDENIFGRFFRIKEKNSSLLTEIFAGFTTFLTMAYIIFVQPQILSGKFFNTTTGMPFDAVMAGTCIAAAVGCFLMGILANYPVALAPGMGENFFFTLTVLPATALILKKLGSPIVPWQAALGIVFISGVIFLILSFLNIRTLILNSISRNLKHAIAAGIGIFIALIGLEKGGIIHSSAGHYLLSENISSDSVLIFIIGFIVIAAFQVLKIHGAIIWGILAGTLTALVMGKVSLVFPFSKPPSVRPIFLQFNIRVILSHLKDFLPFIIIFTVMDMFDTLGTLIGVGTNAGLIKDNKLEKAKEAFASDACATVIGTCVGQSTVTSFIESASGVESGGRTGFTAVITGICFLLALFCAPFVRMVAECPAITAPALIVVGALMMKNIKHIEWDDYSEALPAFLIIIGIPFTFSIADGLTLGFITYPVIKFFGGKAKTIGWLNYVLAVVLILYLIFIK